MRHKAGLFLESLKNKRLRDDMKSLKIAGKGYVFYAYELCKKTGILHALNESPKTVGQLAGELRLKNHKMLEALLDFLVGKKVLKFEGGRYSPTGLVPKNFTKEEQEFITAHYKGSEEWTLFLYEFAEESLKNGTRHEKTGFGGERAVQLWDSVMTGPLYSLRQIAVKKLLSGMGDGARIVDYGCGSGTALVDIMEKSRNRIELVGIDASGDMLKMAEDRIKLIGGTKAKVNLVKKDLSQDFAFDAAFDAAFCSILINHIPEKERGRFFGNVAKNLKADGKFVIFQLVNKNKFERVFSDWLLNVAPSHQGFPFLEDYSAELRDNFSMVEIALDGLIVIAHK